jgi:hypothetical protein
MWKPTERAERWIQVEALCRCAELERQHGASMGQHLDQLNDDKRLVDQMRRLCRNRSRLARFRAVTRGFRPGSAALSAARRDITGRTAARALGRLGAPSKAGDDVEGCQSQIVALAVA